MAGIPDELQHLLTWLQRHGARFDACEARPVPGRGIGLVATRVLEQGEEILFVPRQLWLTRKTRHASCGPLIELAHERGLFAHTMGRLAFLLALESLDPNAFFRPYFDALREPTLPFALADDERAALQGLRFAAWVDTQGRELEEEWSKLSALLHEAAPGSPLAAGFTRDVYAWAYGHVIERSFTVDHEGDEVWVMVPGMDLCNHVSGAPKSYYTQPEGWILESGRHLADGEPICISYGDDKTSRHFLLYYGFIFEGNPNDTLTMRVDVPTDTELDAARSALIEGLGLVTRCRVDPQTEVPRVFLNALLIASMDDASFADAASPDGSPPDWSDPVHTRRALELIEATLQARLDALPTTLDDDRELLASGSLPEGLDRYVRYRVVCKTLLAGVRDRVRAQATSAHAPALGAVPDADPPTAPRETSYISLEEVAIRW